MNLGTFFQSLSFGELSNLSIGENGAGTIKEAEQEKITHFTNQALTQLYSKFPHNVDYVILEQQEGVNYSFLADAQDWDFDPVLLH